MKTSKERLVIYKESDCFPHRAWQLKNTASKSDH